MPHGVSCSVSNCTFWKEGNNCNADAIAIDIDQHASVNFEEEFADSFGELHQDRAPKSSTTCCHTFKPKE